MYVACTVDGDEVLGGLEGYDFGIDICLGCSIDDFVLKVCVYGAAVRLLRMKRNTLEIRDRLLSITGFLLYPSLDKIFRVRCRIPF